MGGNKIVPDAGPAAVDSISYGLSETPGPIADNPSSAELKVDEAEPCTATSVGLASALEAPDKDSISSRLAPGGLAILLEGPNKESNDSSLQASTRSRLFCADESMKTLGSITHCEDAQSFRVEELRRRDSSKPKSAGASRIFISHCWRKTSNEHQLRKRLLIATLSAPSEDGGAGVTYWSDYLDLQAEGPVAWREEIEKGIIHSSKVVCLVDEGWLTSYACLQELAYAKAYNKPLAVVILDQEAWDILTNPHVNAEKAWEMKEWGPSLSSYVGQEIVNVKDASTGTDVVEYLSLGYVRKLFAELSHINFCPCRPLDEINLGLPEVCNKLQKYVTKDLKYYAQHAELQSLALKWLHEGNKRESHMLHLDLAYTWKVWINMATFAGMQPAPTNLQREYVKESLRFARCRRRLLQGVGIMLLLLFMAGMVASIVLAIWAVNSRDRAKEQADIARNQTMVAQVAAELAYNKSVVAETATMLANEQTAIARHQTDVAINQTLYAQQQAKIAALAAIKSVMILLLSIVGKYPANDPLTFITAEQLKGIAHALRLAANTSLVEDLSLRSLAMEAVARIMHADSRGKGLFKCTGACTEASWSPQDDQSLVYGSGVDSFLRVWDPSLHGDATIALDYPDEWIVCMDPPCTNNINSLSWSPNGKYLATASSYGAIMVWDSFNWYLNTSAQPVVMRQTDGADANTLVRWSASNVLAIAIRQVIGSQSVQLWRMLKEYTTDPLAALDSQPSRLMSQLSVTYEPSYTMLLSVAINSTLINCMEWSSDGSKLAVGATNLETLIFHVNPSNVWTGVATVTNTTLSQAVSATLLAWSPVGGLLACSTSKNFVTIWSFKNEEAPFVAATLIVDTPDVLASSVPKTALAWCGDGTILALGDGNGKVTFWDASAAHTVASTVGTLVLKEAMFSVAATSQSYSDIAWSKDRNYVALAGQDTNVRVVDLPWNEHRSWRILRAPGHVGEVTMVVFNPEGNMMASVASDAWVYIWSVKSPSIGSEILAKFQSRSAIYCGAWSPNNTFAIGVDIAGVQLFRVPTFDQLTHSPSANEIVEIWWDATVGIQDPMPPFGAVWSLQFSPDGSKLAAAANTGEDSHSYVRVWDLIASPNGTIYVDLGNLGTINAIGIGALTRSVAWSPDGNLLAAGCEDGKVHVWQTNSWDSESLIISDFAFFTSFVSWSPNGHRLAATTSFTDVIFIYDMEPDGKSYSKRTSLTGACKAFSIVWSPTGNHVIASCVYNGIFLSWDMDHPSSRPAVVLEIPWDKLLPMTSWLYFLAWNHKTNWVAFPHPTTTGTVKANSGAYMFDAGWLDGSLEDWYHMLTYDYVGSLTLSTEDLIALSTDIPENFTGILSPPPKAAITNVQGRSWQVEDLFNALIAPDTTTEISCPSGTKINVVYARYGLSTNTWLNKLTSGFDLTPRLQAQCNAATSCDVTAQVDCYELVPWSDPRFLVVGWTCGRPTGIWLWFDEQVKHDVTLSCNGAQELADVQHAQAFPSGDTPECAACPGAPFTSSVASFCDRVPNSCSFDIDSLGVYDPCPSCSKLWLFKIQCLGPPPSPPILSPLPQLPPLPPPPPMPPPPLQTEPDRAFSVDGINVMILRQGRIAAISCDNDTVIDVRYARFGSAPAPYGVEVTETVLQQCNGLTKCNVTAWHEPDPVPGFPKHLSMGYTCEIANATQTMIYKIATDLDMYNSLDLICPNNTQLDVKSAWMMPAGATLSCAPCPSGSFSSSMALACNGLPACSFELNLPDQCTGCFHWFIIKSNCTHGV